MRVEGASIPFGIPLTKACWIGQDSGALCCKSSAVPNWPVPSTTAFRYTLPTPWCLSGMKRLQQLTPANRKTMLCLPADELLETLQEKLDSRFPGNLFEKGYWGPHLDVRLLDVTQSKRRPSQNLSEGTHSPGKNRSRKQTDSASPVSHIGHRCVLCESGRPFGWRQDPHSHRPVAWRWIIGAEAKVNDFEKSLDQLFAQFQDSVKKLQKLLDIYLDYPVNAMTRVCKS